MISTTKTAAVTMLAALTLAGCGGSAETEARTTTAPAPAASDTASPTDSPSSADTPSPTDSPSAEESDPASTGTGAVDAFTEQGTALEFGEQAVVPFTSEGASGAIGVTAVSIKAGSPAELAALELGDQVKGFTPYYVTFKVTNLSGNDFSFTSLGLVGGLLADGTSAQRVSIIGDFAPCPNASAPDDFNSKGASYTTCDLQLASAGAKVTGASYSSYDSSVNTAPDTDYAVDPITWK